MSIAIIFSIAAALAIAWYYVWCLPGRGRCDVLNCAAGCGERLAFPKKRFPMTPGDTVLMLVITVVYGLTAFAGLGDKAAPQSFCHFVDRGLYVQIELTEPTEITRVFYYTGLKHDKYLLQFSADGENWVDQASMPQEHSDVFKWKTAKLAADNGQTRYIRIIAGKELYLGEVALYDVNGRMIPASQLVYDDGAAPLFDEQELVPEAATYLNSSYFDEIYHARTAYEGLEGETIYETTHPPLGKILISIGITLFGMTPFGWRFIGTLFGALMLPLFYIFIKNMFGKTTVAVCGTVIFAFDFMHFVQTRIATIDTYGVFFTIAAYFFMYRFVTVDRDDLLIPRRKRALPLFLCGLCFGLGAASKWTVIYAGAGLALIWLLYWIFRGRDLRVSGRKGLLTRELLPNIGACLVFFVAVPVVVYYLSYYPYGKAAGMSGAGMYLSGDYARIVWDNQISMFSYHSGVVAEHPYASRWYQWLFDIRPILYYLNYFGDGTKSAFAAFLNPVVCWSGLIAMVLTVPLIFVKKNGRALFILVGYLAQLVPWLFISRLTFAYHYFPCLVFLVLALCVVFDAILKSGRKHSNAMVWGFAVAVVVMFAVFYPVLTGVRVPQWYTNTFLRWFPSWPI